MKTIKQILLMLTVFMMPLGLYGCGDKVKLPEGAGVIGMTVMSDKVKQDTDIIRQGEVIGHMKEDGFFNNGWNFEMNDGESYRIEFGDVDFLTDRPTATTYVFKDTSGKVIGYAQETAIDLADGSSEYEFLFYDENLNEAPYYYDRRVNAFYGYKGNRLASVNYIPGKQHYLNGRECQVHFVYEGELLLSRRDLLFAYIDIQTDISDIYNH